MEEFKCHIEQIIDEIHEELVPVSDRKEYFSQLVLGRISSNTLKLNKRYDKCLDLLNSEISNSKIEDLNISIKSLSKVLSTTYDNLIKEFNQYEKFLNSFENKD